MKDSYVIGVYGVTNATYTIGIASETSQMLHMVEKIPVKIEQEAYTTRYIQWYHWLEDTAVEFSVIVQKGSLDVYITTYDEETSKISMVEALPDSKRKGPYYLENILPTSAESFRRITFYPNMDGYCEGCSYLIGIRTHDKKSSYEITGQSLEAGEH